VRPKRFNFSLLASKADRISPGIYTHNYMNRYKKIAAKQNILMYQSILLIKLP